MNCLKCGKQTRDMQAFCARCLESMEAYPVKHDVRIQLPNRPAPVVPKKSSKKRKNLSPEEQVVYLRGRVRRLTAWVVILSLLLCAACGLVAYRAITQDELDLGKNYTFGNPFD